MEATPPPTPANVEAIFRTIGFVTKAMDTTDHEVNTCVNYLTAKQNLDCQNDNYFVEYGYKYCQAFLARRDEFTPVGQRWVNDTMHCLQSAIAVAIKNGILQCSNVREMAFAAHPTCYVNSGLPYLYPRDYVLILSIIGVKELTTKEGFTQAWETVKLTTPPMLVRIVQGIMELVENPGPKTGTKFNLKLDTEHSRLHLSGGSVCGKSGKTRSVLSGNKVTSTHGGKIISETIFSSTTSQEFAHATRLLGGNDAWAASLQSNVSTRAPQSGGDSFGGWHEGYNFWSNEGSGIENSQNGGISGNHVSGDDPDWGMTVTRDAEGNYTFERGIH